MSFVKPFSKKSKVILTGLSILLISSNLSAQEGPHYDPLARNLIVVSGEAELEIPVNEIKLSFSFEVNQGSFEEGSTQSNRFAKEIKDKATALGLKEVEIVKGWDVVRQTKVSFGSKGRKISNRVILEIRDFSEKDLYALISKIIDASLSVNDAIVLEDVSVALTEDAENHAKEQVTVNALKAMNVNAQKQAEALGRQLQDPKRVFVTSENQREMPTGDYEESYPATRMFQRKVLSSAVNIQKSFKVNAQIQDHIKFKSRVSGVYQLS